MTVIQDHRLKGVPMSEPPKKIDAVRAAMREGDWRRAVSLAARFPRLGADKAAILGAQEAYTRPDFQRQIGKDIDALKAAGIAALWRKYGV